MEEKQKILNILETINLSDKKDIYIENLSAGELQKVNIGLGLLSDADTFLLDEPASNMDLINQIKILKMLNAISKKGKTSIIIMHDLNLAAKYGDCFAGINQNYKIIQKNRNQFFEENNLRDIFNIDFKIIHEGESLYVQVID